jgi:hypothetical protein
MSPHTRRLRAPAILIAALAALLVLATAASAETRTGESSAVIRENFPAGEVTLVKASASYESANGSAVFNVTTATGPGPAGEGSILAALTTSADCTGQTGRASVEQLFFNPPPVLLISDKLSSPIAGGFTGTPLAPVPLPATKSVSGTTATLSVASSAIANAGFNCAVVAATEAGEEEGGEVEELPGGEEELPGATFMSFPISAAAPVVTTTTPAPAVATPAPPVLSISRLKPVTVKTGKWQIVKVKVTNTGATGTGLGSLRVTTAKGVLVKPERQQLPVLAPGATWTMTVRVQLTAKAKSKSNLKLTAAASGVTATGSLVLKAKRAR